MSVCHFEWVGVYFIVAILLCAVCKLCNQCSYIYVNEVDKIKGETQWNILHLETPLLQNVNSKCTTLSQHTQATSRIINNIVFSPELLCFTVLYILGFFGRSLYSVLSGQTAYVAA